MARIAFVDERGDAGAVAARSEVSPYFLALALLLPQEGLASIESSLFGWRRKFWPHLREASDAEVLGRGDKGNDMLRNYRKAKSLARRDHIHAAVDSLCSRLADHDAAFYVEAVIKRPGIVDARRALAVKAFVRLGRRLDDLGRRQDEQVACTLDWRTDSRRTVSALRAVAGDETVGLCEPIIARRACESLCLQAADVLAACAAAPALEADFGAELISTTWSAPRHVELAEKTRGQFARLCPPGNAHVIVHGTDGAARWRLSSGGYEGALTGF